MKQPALEEGPSSLDVHELPTARDGQDERHVYHGAGDQLWAISPASWMPSFRRVHLVEPTEHALFRGLPSGGSSLGTGPARYLRTVFLEDR